MEDLAGILVVLGLIALNGFFVVGEYAVVTARRAALTPRAEAGSKGAQAALRLMDDPVAVISSVQVAITGLGILVGAIGEGMIRELLGDGLPDWAGFLIAFSVVTYLSVVLGELIPKALTLQMAEKLAVLVARPIELFGKAVGPVSWLFEKTAALLLRPFGIKEVTAGEGIRSADELRALVDEAEGAGVIPRAQEELIHNVFDFPDLEAADVMVPAADVVWIDADSTIETAVDTLAEQPHARYPVAEGTLDRAVGVVHSHEVIRAFRTGSESLVREIARPPMIVPESKDLGALLREMRERRQQVAIVVSEYGTTMGIVAIEDILEEIVGDIQDEFELPDATLERIDDHTVRVTGSMSIDDFNESVNADVPHEGPSRTLAGLVFDELGRRPEVDDVVEAAGVRLVVEAVDGNRIAKIRAELPEPEPEPAASDES